MHLTRRTQILLDEERHASLRRRAAASGRSVGDLIREAIDLQLADEEENARAAAGARERALESFMAAEPMAIADWPGIELELEGALERGTAGE